MVSRPSRSLMVTVTKTGVMRPCMRGFTMVELLVTIAIIAVLVLLAFVTLNRMKLAAYKAELPARVRSLRAAFQDRHTGAGKAGSTLILDGGMTVRNIKDNLLNLLAIAPQELECFRAICERERCPFAVVGTATTTGAAASVFSASFLPQAETATASRTDRAMTRGWSWAASRSTARIVTRWPIA